MKRKQSRCQTQKHANLFLSLLERSKLWQTSSDDRCQSVGLGRRLSVPSLVNRVAGHVQESLQTAIVISDESKVLVLREERERNVRSLEICTGIAHLNRGRNLNHRRSALQELHGNISAVASSSGHDWETRKLASNSRNLRKEKRKELKLKQQILLSDLPFAMQSVSRHFRTFLRTLCVPQLQQQAKHDPSYELP